MRSTLPLLALVLALAPAARGDDAAERLAAALRAHRAGELELEAALDRLGPLDAAAQAALEAALRAPEQGDLQAELVGAASARLGPRAEPFLLALLGPPPDAGLRRAALERLATAGGAVAARALLEAPPGGGPDDAAGADAWAAALAGSVRNAGLEAEALVRLRELSRQEDAHAAPALAALAAIGGARALPDLAQALDRPALRRVALVALAAADRADPAWQLERPDAEEELRPALGEALDDEAAPAVERLMALQAIRVWGDLGSVEPLLRYAESEAPHRKAALDALAELAGARRDGPAAWRAWWAEVRPTWEQYPALLAAVRAAGPGARDALARVARIPDDRTALAVDDLVVALAARGWGPVELALAEAACQALADAGSTRGATPLLRLLDDAAAPAALRERAAWALGILAGRQGPPDAAAWRAVFPDALPLAAAPVEVEPASPGERAAAPPAERAPRPRPPRPEAVPGRRARVEAGALALGAPGARPAPAAPATPGAPRPALAAPVEAPPAPVAAPASSPLLPIAAVVAGFALLLALIPARKETRAVAQVARSIARLEGGVASRRTARELDAADDLEAAEVSGVVLNRSGSNLTAVPLGGARAADGGAPPAALLADAPPPPVDPEVEALAVALGRLGGALVHVTAQLRLRPGEPRALFRAGGAASLEDALASLRGLGALVSSVTVGLAGLELDLVVLSRAIELPAAVPAARDRTWAELAALLARGGDGLEEVEVRRGAVWHTVHAGDGAAALAGLGAVAAEGIEEVRARVRGGPRITLLEAAGHRGDVATWSGFLGRLERRAAEVEVVELLDAGGGATPLFRATDRPRFAATRRALRDDRLGGWTAALRVTGLDVPLPDDPGARDAVVADLGPEAVARIGRAGEAPIFVAEDMGRLTAIVASLSAEAPDARSVRARTTDGETFEVVIEGGAGAARARPPATKASPALAEAPSPTAASAGADTAQLEGALVAVMRLEGAVCSVSASLSTDPGARRELLQPAGGLPGALDAARGLAPLLDRVTVTLTQGGPELVVFERAAADARGCAQEAQRAWGAFLAGLEGDVEAFDLIEVRERGRLWRVVLDASLRPGDALAALGAIEADAVDEVRARTRAGQRATLYARPGSSSSASSGGATVWVALLGEVHRLAPRLESLEVRPAGEAPRELFLGGDAARFAAARAALGARGGLVSVLARLRGTGVELPIAGDAPTVCAALEELGPWTVAEVLLDGPDGPTPLYASEDAARLGDAIDRLAELRPADVVEVRARLAGEAAPVVLYPRAR